jgi:hypothetical protein
VYRAKIIGGENNWYHETQTQDEKVVDKKVLLKELSF